METHFLVIHVQITCVLEQKQARFTCSTAAIYEPLKANVFRFAYCLLPSTTTYATAKRLQAFWERERQHDYGLLVGLCMSYVWVENPLRQTLHCWFVFLISDTFKALTMAEHISENATFAHAIFTVCKIASSVSTSDPPLERIKHWRR